MQHYKDNIWYKIMNYGLEYIGLYYGNYRGFVIDNEDPLKLNRLQVHVPILNPVGTGEIWAFPKNIWGAKNYGIQLLPQKGDMIWVSYQNGRTAYPIWEHAGYGEKELPEEFKTVKHYGFKTPKGALLLINDNKEEEEILIRHANTLEWVKINKEQLELEAKLIKLGAEGEEWAVMGETLKEKMEAIMDKLDETYTAINAHTHTTPTGPSGPPINLPDFQSIKQAMVGIKGEFEEFLSGKVKIDK